jgi:hypothetical protein
VPHGHFRSSSRRTIYIAVWAKLRMADDPSEGADVPTSPFCAMCEIADPGGTAQLPRSRRHHCGSLRVISQVDSRQPTFGWRNEGSNLTETRFVSQEPAVCNPHAPFSPKGTPEFRDARNFTYLPVNIAPSREPPSGASTAGLPGFPWESPFLAESRRTLALIATGGKGERAAPRK